MKELATEVVETIALAGLLPKNEETKRLTDIEDLLLGLQSFWSFILHHLDQFP